MPFTIPNSDDAAFQDQAEPDSIDFNILQTGIAGNGVISGLEVSALGSPNMSVAVSAGTAILSGTITTVSAGTLTITTADSTNPRFDLVRVNSAGSLSVLAGTAASNAVFPTPATTDVVLAAVYVPASDTAINSNQIVDKRIIVNSLSGIGPNVLTTVQTVSTAGATGAPGYLTASLSPTTAVIRITEGGWGDNLAFSGISANGATPDNGRIVLIYNDTDWNIYLYTDVDNYSFISAAYRFDTTVNLTLESKKSAFVIYDSSLARWRAVEYASLGYRSFGLSQFASTTSAQLAGVISDETGTGSLVFATNGTLTTPTIGTAGFRIAGSTSGSTTITTSATASGTVVIPSGAGTVATLVGTQTLTNKTLTTPQIQSSGLGIAGSSSGTTTIITAAAASGTIIVPAGPGTLSTSTASTTESLTNKTINFGSNTITGTLAQFNTALSDQDFASLAGTETLSNKTLVTANLGTPSAIVLTNATGLPNSATSGTSTATANTLVLRDANTNFAAGTITATLIGAAPAGSLSGGTLASGVTVSSLTSFGNSPTLITPNIGVATGTSLSVSGNLTSTAGTISALALGGSLLVTSVPAALTTAGTAGAATLPARSDHSHPTTGLSTSSGTETLTNKTINFGSNTITTTLAQLSSAVSDATLVSTTGTETLTNKTLTTPVIDNPKMGYTTTATAGATTTLSGTSSYQQFFTGTSTGTITLPVVTTLSLGQGFEIHNNSTGNLTINSSGGNLVDVVEAGKIYQAICILTTGTTAASWEGGHIGSTNDTGTGAMVFATSPSLVTPQIGSGGFGLAGSTSGTTTVVTAAAAAGTMVVPGFSGTVATLFGTETLTNKTFVAPTLGTATGTSLSVTGALTSTAGTISAIALGGSLLVTSAPAALTSAGTYGAATLPARSDHAHPTSTTKLSVFGTTSSSELAGIITDETGSGALVFAGSSTSGGGPALYNANLIATTETMNVLGTAIAAGTWAIDTLTASVWYYTGTATANATLVNFRGNSSTTLSSLLAVGESMTVVYMQTNGTTAYKPTNFAIDGTNFTAKWQGGTAPTAGNASSIDAYTFTIIKTAATPTYTVLGAQTKYA